MFECDTPCVDFMYFNMGDVGMPGRAENGLDHQYISYGKMHNIKQSG